MQGELQNHCISLLPCPMVTQGSRDQSWSFLSKPTSVQDANARSLGGRNVVGFFFFFYVQAFYFLISQLTENTFVLLLKTKIW